MFLEFAWNAWEKRKFDELYKKNTEKNDNKFSVNHTISIATMTFNHEGNGAAESSLPNYRVIRVGDIAFEGHTSKQFSFGRFVLNDLGDGIMSPRFTCLRPVKPQIIQFWKQYIHYEPIIRPILVRSTKLGTMMNELVIPDLMKQYILTPSVPEQVIIGKLLDRTDHLIAATQDKIDAFEQIKKAFLQHLFDQSWRFGEYSELWTSHLLGEITSKVTEKNTENLYHETFTNSAKYGIVEQQSFFDKLISNEANLTNYYVVRENDFVYNPRISNLAPVGPVRRNKLNRTGVMSPLYYVFKATNAAYPMFLEYFFKGESWYRFMYLNGDTGARSDRFAIKDKVFEQMPVKLPEESEQKKIGALLQNLETVMNQTQERLQKIRTIKDSLLKSLFV